MSTQLAPEEQAQFRVGVGRWQPGELVDIITTDHGLEKDVTIIGPARSGKPGAMRCEFADGRVEDWDAAEFRSSAAFANVPIAPITYKVLSRSTVRSGMDNDSPKVGNHTKDTIITVVQESCNKDGLMVMQTITSPAGWVKLKTHKGKMLMERLGEEEQSFEREAKERLTSACPECVNGGQGSLCDRHDQERVRKGKSMAGGFNRRLSVISLAPQQVLASMSAAASPKEWSVGAVVDVDTDDGMDSGAIVLGPSQGGDPAQMQIRFADGTVDDWDTEDFHEPDDILASLMADAGDGASPTAGGSEAADPWADLEAIAGLPSGSVSQREPEPEPEPAVAATSEVSPAMPIDEWLRMAGASECEPYLRAEEVESLEDLLDLVQAEGDLQELGINVELGAVLWPAIAAAAAAVGGGGDSYSECLSAVRAYLGSIGENGASLAEVVVESLAAADYEASTWVDELQTMQNEGILLGFLNQLKPQADAAAAAAEAAAAEPEPEPESEPEPEAAVAEAAEEPAVASANTLMVECPEGFFPGDEIDVEFNGREIVVEIPEGVSPGEEFEIQVPSEEGGGSEESSAEEEMDPALAAMISGLEASVAAPEPEPEPEPEPDQAPEIRSRRDSRRDSIEVQKAEPEPPASTALSPEFTQTVNEAEAEMQQMQDLLSGGGGGGSPTRESLSVNLGPLMSLATAVGDAFQPARPVMPLELPMEPLSTTASEPEPEPEPEDVAAAKVKEEADAARVQAEQTEAARVVAEQVPEPAAADQPLLTMSKSEVAQLQAAVQDAAAVEAMQLAAKERAAAAVAKADAYAAEAAAAAEQELAAERAAATRQAAVDAEEDALLIAAQEEVAAARAALQPQPEPGPARLMLQPAPAPAPPSEAVPPPKRAPTRLPIVPRKVAPRRMAGTAVAHSGTAMPAEDNIQKQFEEIVASQTISLKIICPPNVSPGQMILVNTPDGVQLEVAVPDGVEPGGVFIAQVAIEDFESASESASAQGMSEAGSPPQSQRDEEEYVDFAEDGEGEPGARSASSSPGWDQDVFRSDAKASALASQELLQIKKRLRSTSYGVGGEDPRRLFDHFDRDNSGYLDFGEFRSAMRKGAQVTIAMMPDSELRKVFYAVDANDDGDVSLDELTSFIWDGSGDTPREMLLSLSPVDDEFYWTHSGKVRTKRSQKKDSSRLSAQPRHWGGGGGSGSSAGGDSPRGSKKKGGKKRSEPIEDAGFLSPTTAYTRKTQMFNEQEQHVAAKKKAKEVDGVVRMKDSKRDPTPGVGSYDPQYDTVAARAQKAIDEGKRRASAQPTSPRTAASTQADTDYVRRQLRQGRSHWVGDSAGEGSSVPMRLGHAKGLAGKKPMITGRCTFNG